MSSEGSLARLPGARVTLLDQAELATEISFSLMTKRRQPIKVTPNGSAAVGLLARRFRRSQPEALRLLVSSRDACKEARAALEQSLQATKEDKRLHVKFRHGQPQFVVLQLKPTWLSSPTPAHKTQNAMVRFLPPRTLLLYLLYDVIDAIEHRADPSPDAPDAERLRGALSALYIFSLLVSPREPSPERRHVELSWSRTAWVAEYDRPLRADEGHKVRYGKVREVLAGGKIVEEELLHEWAGWLVAETGQARIGEEAETGRSGDERVDRVVDALLSFLQKAQRMIAGPHTPVARDQVRNGKPETAAVVRGRARRKARPQQVECCVQ